MFSCPDSDSDSAAPELECEEEEEGERGVGRKAAYCMSSHTESERSGPSCHGEGVLRAHVKYCSCSFSSKSSYSRVPFLPGNKERGGTVPRTMKKKVSHTRQFATVPMSRCFGISHLLSLLFSL